MHIITQAVKCVSYLTFSVVDVGLSVSQPFHEGHGHHLGTLSKAKEKVRRRKMSASFSLFLLISCCQCSLSKQFFCVVFSTLSMHLPHFSHKIFSLHLCKKCYTKGMSTHHFPNSLIIYVHMCVYMCVENIDQRLPVVLFSYSQMPYQPHA